MAVSPGPGPHGAAVARPVAATRARPLHAPGDHAAGGAGPVMAAPAPPCPAGVSAAPRRASGQQVPSGFAESSQVGRSPVSPGQQAAVSARTWTSLLAHHAQGGPRRHP